jgi:hypothetical protein
MTALARTTDPTTSHAAAASIGQASITATQQVILSLLFTKRGDEELTDRYYNLVSSGRAPNASPSGIRSRRAALVDAGLVEDTGDRVKTASGRQAIVWGITLEGRNAWARFTK